jgi:hypothetical protein
VIFLHCGSNTDNGANRGAGQVVSGKVSAGGEVKLM